MSEDKFTNDNNSDDGLKEVHNPEESKDLEEMQRNEDAAVNIDAENASKENQADRIQQTEVKKDELSKSETGDTTASTDGNESEKPKKKSKLNIYSVIRIFCLIGFIIFTALFINEVIIQPYRIKKSIELTRELYNKPTEAPVVTASPTQPPTDEAAPTSTVQATPTPDPNRDAQGRLLQFKDLLATNGDVKGWLTIPDTNIDYVVMQSSKDNPDYYLDKDINGDYSKAGTLFLDPQSSIEDNTQNLVIHGHNMVSTAEKMFHFLLKYKKADYYSKRPVISFDSIYNTGKWKIFAVFITNGSNAKEPLFDYRKSTFKDSSDFLNFVYQLRIRSLLNIDTVDVNENDQLLTLSTCSYELDNYRFVVVARKVRDGEDTSVDVSSVVTNPDPLYPKSYYKRYGGEAPDVAATFEEALKNGQINWYTAPADKAAE